MTKNWKKITAENFLFIFLKSKTAIYLSLGLHKVCPSYRRSLQFSKEAIQHFKTLTFTNYCLLGSFLPSWIRIHRPDWIRIQSGSGSTTLKGTNAVEITAVLLKNNAIHIDSCLPIISNLWQFHYEFNFFYPWFSPVLLLYVYRYGSTARDPKLNFLGWIIISGSGIARCTYAVKKCVKFF
jgi:hypothetical protein